MARPKATKAVKIHEDEPEDHDEETVMDESRDPDDESGATRTDDSEESELDESVAEDIARFEASFKGINKRYRLISRIGEGEWHGQAG
jgi:cell division control protein 7